VRLLAVIALGAALSLGMNGSGRPPVLATIATGTAPCGAVAAFGSVWVANDGGTLARINPATNRVVRRVRTGSGSCSLAAGAGALWIANYKRGLIRVLPRSGRVRRVSVGAVPFDALVAFNRVWVTAWEAGKLAVVDPKTLRVMRRIDIGARPMGLTVRDGAIWVGFGRDATSIARVAPATYAVERVPVGDRAPGWFVEGTQDLWIQANDGDVLHVDPSTGRVLARMQVGRTLTQGAIAPDGTIWMPDKEQSIVYRIDPKRERVIDSFPAGPGAYLALRAYRSMWVASYAGTDVWRFKP
jgi:YVTN family beta-propeller protein